MNHSIELHSPARDYNTEITPNTSSEFNESSHMFNDPNYSTMDKKVKSFCHRCLTQQKMRSTFEQMLNLMISDELIPVLKNSPDTETFVMQRVKEIVEEFMRKSEMASDSQKELLEENQNLKSEMKQLRAEMKSLEGQATVMNGQCDYFKGKISDLERQLSLKSSDGSKSSQQLKKLSSKIQFIQSEKTEIEAINCNLSNRIEELELQIQKMSSEKNKYAIENSKIEKLEFQIKELKRQLQSKADKFSSLKSQFAANSSELKKVKMEKASSEELSLCKKEQLEEEISALKRTIENIKAQMIQKSNKKQYKDHIQNLEAKFIEIKEGSVKVQQKLEETLFENEQKEQTIKNLKEELVSSNEKVSTLRTEKHELELENIQNKDKMSELFVQNSSIVEDLNKVQQEVSISSNSIPIFDN